MRSQRDLIVITGGAGGIGTACVKAFKDKHLVVTDYSEEMVAEVVEKLQDQGYKVSGIACDITNQDDIAKLIDFVNKSGSFKALIHTAGVSGSAQDLKKIFTIDLIATEYLVDAFYEIAQEGSVAVLLSSMMAHSVPANPEYDDALRNPQKDDSFDIVSKFTDGNSNLMYDFAKRGVQLLSVKNVGKWGQKKARIVTVSPGVIETEMALKAAEEHPERMEMIKNATPLQRNGKPEDVVGIIKFLASNQAGFITGTDVLVDGGVIHNIKKM